MVHNLIRSNSVASITTGGASGHGHDRTARPVAQQNPGGPCGFRHCNGTAAKLSMTSLALAWILLSAQQNPSPDTPDKTEIPPLKQVMVVTGSRLEELQTESAVKVEAVTRQQMQQTGYERVSDVLAEMPGVVTRSGSTATVAGEQIQGIDSRQVLILQDGLPVMGARGIKSGIVNLNRQNVGRLQQVEVAKGAGSPLYGTDAIGGVINMITREPSEKIEGGISVSGGSLGALDGRYDIGTRWNKLSLFADLEHHRMDNYSLIPNSPTTVGPTWKRYDGLFKARYRFTDTLAAGFTANGYHNNEVGRNLAETGLTLNNANDSTQSYAAIVDWVPDARTTVQGRAYAARYDENARIDSIPVGMPPSFANLNERYHRLDATASRQFGSHNLLQGGVEWSQDLYRGANRVVGDNAGQQVTLNDYWLNDRFQFGRLTVTAGGRFHHHSLFGNAAVPRVGVVYKVSDNWIIRSSFGKGFRAPDLGQLYYRFANPASFYQVIGNPNLRPEMGASWSAGAVYRNRRFRLGVNLFQNNVRNLINSQNVGTPRTQAELDAILLQYGIPAAFNPFLNRQTFVYLNLSRIHTQGFEIDGEVNLFSGWRARWGYTFLDAKDELTDLRLNQRHRHQGFAGADYVNAHWGLIANVRGTFYSNWLLNSAAGTRGYGYGIWDLYASKTVAQGVQLFGSIDNMGNSRDRKLALATPTFDRPDYGRMYRAGLRYRFGGKE